MVVIRAGGNRHQGGKTLSRTKEIDDPSLAFVFLSALVPLWRDFVPLAALPMIAHSNNLSTPDVGRTEIQSRKALLQ